MTDKPKIMVTGANGQLGKEIQQLCSAYPQYEFVFLAKDDFPLEQYELGRNFFRTLTPAFCINCAAYTAVDKAEEEKELAMQINGEAVGVLAAICKEYDCKLVHLSTDYIFDGMGTTPYGEDFPPNPINSYGETKLEGEKQVMQLNPDSIVIRTSWVYSPYGKNFVKTMLKLLKEKSEICVVNDQVGSPTYAADIAAVILQLLGKWKPGIYHYSNDGVISWYEFAEAIKEIAGSSCIVVPVTTADYPTLARRPAFSVLDKTKIQQAFGIKLNDWKASLSDCIRRITLSQ
jgi:dTDP-4-dehydrorhamnose reductase